MLTYIPKFLNKVYIESSDQYKQILLTQDEHGILKNIYIYKFIMFKGKLKFMLGM